MYELWEITLMFVLLFSGLIGLALVVPSLLVDLDE